MAASINDKFTEATNGSRPVPTTLTALLPSGASPGTATCGALTGWATATAVHFVIYTVDVNGRKVSGSQTDWKGVVSGSTITGLVLKAGTNNGYAIGAVVEAAPTAAWADDVTEGIMVEHKQTGAHAAITADSVTSAGAISGTTITGSAINSTGDMQLRSTSLETVHSQFIYDFVYSGGVWSGDSYGSTLAASMTAMVAYVNGRRYSVSTVTARAFTASKDTYIDMDNTGTLVYTEVANNAASPALAANSIRIGIIVSGAGNIAAVGSVNQGQENKILPIASSIAYSVTDSLGNLICPRDPNRRVLGYRQILTTFSTGPEADITGVYVPIIVPTARKVKVSFHAGQYYNSVDAQRCQFHINEDGTNVQALYNRTWTLANLGNGAANLSVLRSPSAGSHYYKARCATLSGTMTAFADANTPMFILVELA